MSIEPFEWGVRTQPYAGETKSGDKHVIKIVSSGVLVALIDALGHGAEAAYAANVAANILEQYAENESHDLAALVERCHAAMRPTRGATISLALFNWQQRTMTWLGIGNVAGVLRCNGSHVEPRVKSLLVRSGVVGDRLPGLQSRVFTLAEENNLIMATDGIRAEFADKLPSSLQNPQRQADQIFNNYTRLDDDSTVLVFQCERICDDSFS